MYLGKQTSCAMLIVVSGSIMLRTTDFLFDQDFAEFAGRMASTLVIAFIP